MFKKWKKTVKENQKGLTLVELLAVIVILAIIGAIAFIMIGNVMENSRKDAHIANAQQVIAAAKMYDTTEEEIDATTGVTLTTLQEKELIGELTSPWKEDTYVTAGDVKVTKDTSGAAVEYKISGFAVDGKCSIKNGTTEKTLNEGDRDTLCKGE